VIDLTHDQLTFSFEEEYPDARLTVEFQRTIRIPGGGTDMPRLPSLGRYPLYSVSEYADRVPPHWREMGGAMLPMYQSEAMWLSFRPAYSVAHGVFYPFAIQVEIGGVDAITGERASSGLHESPQDHLVITDQAWLGGYRSSSGEILQFSPMPLGSGYTPVTADSTAALAGQLRLRVFPMGGRWFQERFPTEGGKAPLEGSTVNAPRLPLGRRDFPMGNDALIRQRLEEGLFPISDWSIETESSYCLHLANSLHWCAITGAPPPTTAPRLRLQTLSHGAPPVGGRPKEILP